MYICVCKGISDRQVRRALDRGARSVAELQREVPVGVCCGQCLPAVRAAIREHEASGCPALGPEAPQAA
jgi:bacterioferritin-associated ferredoxin